MQRLNQINTSTYFPFSKLCNVISISTLELKFVILILQAMQNFVWNFAVFLVAFASFTTYSLSVSDTLSVGTAFVSLGKL